MAVGWVRVALLSLAALGMVAKGAGAEPLVYVSNERSNNVTVIDAAADKVVATIPSAIGLAASA
jgi:YVTN family beta-propeller protein